MRTVIDVDKNIWANVKHFATVEEFTLNAAVKALLEEGLSKLGYDLNEHRHEQV